MGKGEVEGCASCAKYLLIAFNTIFFLVGAALIGIGLYVLLSPNTLDILAVVDSGIIKTGIYFIIGLGGFIFIVGFLGCCGACCENRLFLILYFIIVLIIFLAQVAISVAVLAYQSTVDEFVSKELNGTMDSYKASNGTDTYSVGWNAIQLVLECCGTNGYQDWANTKWAGTESYDVGGVSVTLPFPITCCKVDDPNKIVKGGLPTPINVTSCLVDQTDYLNRGGCYKSLQNYIKDQIVIVGAAGVGLALFEIFCMIFAICVCNGISKAANVV